VVAVVVDVEVGVVSVVDVAVPLPPQPARAKTRAISQNPETVRPLIGITAYAEDATWGVWTAHAALAPIAYVRRVERAGGRPVLLPPSEDGVEETLDGVHGLVFTGGPDLDPAVYDAEPHPATNSVRPERDRAEIALLNAALARDMPVLAICRGSQILNVALGGDLEQHVPDLVGHEGHKEVPGVFSEHAVAIEPDSHLHRILGAGVSIKSHHHQGYGHLGRGLVASARAEDGTLEALEEPTRSFAIGVLWHPEEGDDARLFDELVAEARGYRERRG
jgi:putative glutamine amidotransferase